MVRVAPVLLAIGTTHPLNVAGLGLVARVAGRLGIRVVTIVAGVSAQNARTVLVRTPVDDATIGAQFEALREVPVDAIHIGALIGASSVREVARGLRVFSEVPVICDPVIAATGGDRLADDETVAALREALFVNCTLVTPNLDEAAYVLRRKIVGVDAMEVAARDFLTMGPGAVLIKGGHLTGDTTDVLADATGVRRFVAPRIDATLRGTGDLLASAIAARRAWGDTLVESIDGARAFVRNCLAESVPFAGTRTVR